MLLRRTFVLMLAGLLLTAAFNLQPAWAQTGADAQAIERARANVQKAGVGEKARVEVSLRDHTKLKGYVSDAGTDTFTVTDTKTGATRTLAYTDVTKVKPRGNGLSTPTKLIITGAVAAGVIITWLIVKPALCDGGAQTRGPC